MKNLYLTGYRCTGKTSVGRMLAEKMNWAFVDADEKLVSEAGMTVAAIVERFGWDDFRNRESAVLQAVSTGYKQVVATGGGVILRESNRKTMKETGVVVWLNASVETITHRMENDEMTDGQRPGLTNQGAVREIEETLTQRTPLYTSAMDFPVDTDCKSLEEICDEILEKLMEQ